MGNEEVDGEAVESSEAAGASGAEEHLLTPLPDLLGRGDKRVESYGWESKYGLFN